MANFKTKTKLQADAGILLPAETAERVVILNEDGEIKSSDISTTTLSYLDATSSIQDQLDSKLEVSDLDDLNDKVDDLISLSGVSANSTDLGEFEEEIIPDNSKIKEALQALETAIATIPQPFFYAGKYNPVTNTPDIDDAGARVKGAVYYVEQNGSHDFGEHGGVITMSIGDKLAYNGETWDLWDHTDQVTSVFGRTGLVTAQSGDYSAQQVSFEASDSELVATDVRAAIEEVDAKVENNATDIEDHIASESAHAAENITLSSTKFDATDVKAGLEELADEISLIPSPIISSIVDTDSVDLGISAGALSAEVKPAGVDHNALQNYEANEHVDHSTVSIQAGAGLIGGGDITESRTLAVDIDGQTAMGSAPDQADSFMIYDASAASLKKVTYAELLAGIPKGSPGDIEETSFSGANNVTTPANVTGLAFDNAVVRSFKSLVTVIVDADEDLYEVFTLEGVQKASGWDMSVTATGDESGVVFDITGAGQVQYTSSDYAGYNSLTIKFRAITLSV